MGTNHLVYHALEPVGTKELEDRLENLWSRIMYINSMTDSRKDSRLRCVTSGGIQGLQDQSRLIGWEIAIRLTEDEVVLAVHDVYRTSEIGGWSSHVTDS